MASAEAERRKASGLPIKRAAALAHIQVASSGCAARTKRNCVFRRFAPLFLAHDLVRKPDTTFRDHA